MKSFAYRRQFISFQPIFHEEVVQVSKDHLFTCSQVPEGPGMFAHNSLNIPHFRP
jgi:hypothetical protein